MKFQLIILLCVLTIIPSGLFSQETDTTKQKAYENFFGSDCPRDTVKIWLAENDYCLFYAEQFKLSRIKNNKVKWTLTLDEFRKSDYTCIAPLNRKGSSKGRFKNKKQIVCVLGYINEKEVKRQYISLPSGKQL